MPPGVTDIPGLEVAGEVAAVGARVTRFTVGERAMALVAGGGYAEYCPAHERIALPIPDRFSFVEGAAIPEAFFTVWSNLFERGRLAAGETVLIHGGTSGIGTTAIQLAKARGATVIVTAGSEAKCAACLKLGADVAIDYRTEDFVARTRAATGGRGADVILDIVGGDYIARNYAAAAPEGRIVQIATQTGTRAEVDVRQIMVEAPDPHRLDAARRARWHSRPRSPRPFAPTSFRCSQPAPSPRSSIRPSRSTDAAGAHRRMESSAHIGKIVLTVEN